MSNPVELYGYQEEAVRKMKNGCILCGGVGSGKSRTSIAYYFEQQGGKCTGGEWQDMVFKPQDLYIITTARKRDTKEWEEELKPFDIFVDQTSEKYVNSTIIDSWNNIQKYIGVRRAFFIFDEQRVVGKGAWVKAFLRIAKENNWILLSATPGDTWEDYIPVFIANGFYRNRTEFCREHCVYSRFSKYPKIEKYINTGRLSYYRRQILIGMDFQRQTVSNHESIWCEYEPLLYKSMYKTRWNAEENRPIESASELCFELRKIVNSNPSRIDAVIDIVHKKRKVIVFYNYNYELELLKSAKYGIGFIVSEWNGHIHDPLPEGEKWVYLVQYTAGAEGWNCITTDTIIFFSQNYSYKIMEQAAGRIDRLNTPYETLWYYHLKSHSPIDISIERALNGKKRFNEEAFVYGKSRNKTA